MSSHYGMDVHCTLVLQKELKPKLFGVLVSIDIIVSVRRFFTEMTMSIDNKMNNNFGFRHFSKRKKSKHHSYCSISLA